MHDVAWKMLDSAPLRVMHTTNTGKHVSQHETCLHAGAGFTAFAMHACHRLGGVLRRTLEDQGLTCISLSTDPAAGGGRGV